MGNAPSSKAPAAKLQETLNNDVQRVKSAYGTTQGERTATENFNQELKRDDPKRFYDFQGKLGEGAFGAVFEVTKKSNGEQYACKQINTASANCKDEMLHREVGAMMKCDHPSLITIQDVFQHGKCLYIVMDLVPSPGPGVCPDLFSWITESTGLGARNATPGQVATIVHHVASAIKYMNDEMGALHRDLKPENVLVGPDGIDSLKVTDFGLARLGVEQGGEFAGTFQAGTEGYCAPELIDRSKMVDNQIFYGQEPFKVDVFSLGVVMFICYTKVPPFGLGPSAGRKVLDGNYDRSAMNSIRPVEARQLCMKMIETDQQKRYSIEQVLADPWLNANAGKP